MEILSGVDQLVPTDIEKEFENCIAGLRTLTYKLFLQPVEDDDVFSHKVTTIVLSKIRDYNQIGYDGREKIIETKLFSNLNDAYLYFNIKASSLVFNEVDKNI